MSTAVCSYPKYTPWGEIQHETHEADGIVFYSTSSHGGYWLSPYRQNVVAERFPWFHTFAGGPWYEEDQDWSIVALAFPELHDDGDLRGAVRTVRCSAKPFDFGTPDKPQVQRYQKWEATADWLDNTDEGMAILDRVSQWESEHAEMWERGSTGTCRDGWWIDFIRVRDRARREVVMPDYPGKRFYTSDELDAYAAE
jgi:hypothetical protein